MTLNGAEDRVTRPQLEIQLPKIQRIDEAGGGWHFDRDIQHQWCWFKDAFTQTELDAIVCMGEQIEMQRGVTGNGDVSELRNSYVSWLFPNDITSWVFERIQLAVQNINLEYFGFELTGLLQGLQFTKYSAPGQHYTWHVDRGHGVGVRKLSLSLQLSDPAEYKGGDLQFKFGEEEEIASRERGMMAIFPSWALHRVTPVTEGTRYSLVAWVSGPPFK